MPIYELWPGPTQGQSFYVRYQIRGVDFSSPTDVQPYGIPDQLIIQWALAYYAYPWARMNLGRFPALEKVNWSQAIEQAKEDLHGNLRKNKPGLVQAAIRQDDNQATRSILRRGHGLRRLDYPWPLDANFLQSHLVPLP